MKPIVVVGSINMDLVSRIERIPRAGETLIGSSFEIHSGGKGANQAVAIARLGYPSILLGALGDDIFGQKLLATLSDYGVDTSHINVVAGASGVASIVVDAAGENTIIVTPGANAHVTPDYLSSKLGIFRSAGMVLAQLEIPAATVDWLASVCADFGVPFMLDPAPACSLSSSTLRRSPGLRRMRQKRASTLGEHKPLNKLWPHSFNWESPMSSLSEVLREPS